MNFYLHSSAILLNSFSMTALILVCGLAGEAGLAADIAIVQGSTLALFFAFSANARNLIFADKSGTAPHLLLRIRLPLLVPLAAFSFVLSSIVGPTSEFLAVVLIVRRCAEWIGEVFLSSCEVRNLKRPTALSVISEATTFLIAVVLIFSLGVDPPVAMALWSLAPVVVALTGKLSQSSSSENITENFRKLMPNLGSTTIIGITVYVFRLSIILLVGRVAAGDLFTAFAIGGLLPTIYNNSIGPSLALKNNENGLAKESPKPLFPLVASLFFVGMVLVIISLMYPLMATFLDKDDRFWLSVGLSLSGGAVMMLALRMRIRLLQCGRNLEIFGADAISNVLIIIAVPYLYHLLGAHSLEGLYLLSAILTICIYWSVHRRTEQEVAAKPINTKWLYSIGIFLIFPIFFQIESGIFRDSSFIFDTGRLLNKLPIPFSVFALAGGILLLGRFRDANRTLIVFFFMALLLVIASLLAREPNTQVDRLILMAQYLLPILGLVLGEMYGSASEDREFEKACLTVVYCIVPAQLFFSWLQGFAILTPNLYFFSIYQHLHYVPVVLVLAYCLAFASLWNRARQWRIALAILLPWMAMYVAASYAITVAIVFLGILVTLFVVLYKSVMSRCVAAGILVLTLVVGISYGMLTRTQVVGWVFPVSSSILEASNEKKMITLATQSTQNITERIENWKHFGKGAFSSPKEFFLGHTHLPDRRVHPSAHNYYLDMLYNFGFLALIPLLCLLAYTTYLVYRFRGSILTDPFLLILVVVVFIVFAVENQIKVGLRQPYPGILGFFLLGYLQARLVRISAD